MKKAFDQTIRDIKREVNKKVLKVPSVEQKVLDATSNEPWGPHGSLLADIAQATRNYYEYQMIMSVIWKRINDTGKNWRHVYKALTVLEYLVAHGSERVIEEIREHAYQISTLSDFQYIDSSGRDQGNNVRRKSQSLVVLVNDKERIEEVRQKAATNWDKFRSTYAMGGMYRPGSGGYGDDRYEGRYGGREDERNGNGRDDERYGRHGDSYNREGGHPERDSEEHYPRDMYRNDDSRNRSPSAENYQYETRSHNSDRDGGHVYDDDDRQSSRGSSVRPEDHGQDGRPIERKFSEQNLGAPPSYEEAVGDSRSPVYSERDGETPPASAPQSSSPTAGATPQSSSPVANVGLQSSSPIANAVPHSSSPGIIPSQTAGVSDVLSNPNVENDAYDEFDPRGSVSVTPSTSNNAEMDLFGSLSDVFLPNQLTIMPAPSGSMDMGADSTAASVAHFPATTSESAALNQSFDDSFGDSPFKAIPSGEPSTQPQNFASMTSFRSPVNTMEYTQPVVPNVDSNGLEFTDAFPGANFYPTDVHNTHTLPNSQYLFQEAQSLDILAGILPPSGPAPTSHVSFPAYNGIPATAAQQTFSATNGLPPAMAPQTVFPTASGFIPPPERTSAPFPQMTAQDMTMPSTQLSHQSSLPYSNPNVALQAPTGSLSRHKSDFLGDLLPENGPTIPSLSHSAPSSSAGPLTLVPQQSSKVGEKFEPKSAVWADTLSKGLVNLDISGPKCNPTSDIGIDFESLNRKEKRMEKPSATPATSIVTMGKAMGSGSGIGRAGAGAMRPMPNPIMGSGMGMGMGGPGVGMGMGGYGSMNQQPMGTGVGGMGMGMGMGTGMNMGGFNMGGMNMGMGQGMHMQPSNGVAPGNYNSMMGRGGYPQQPYGGGYQ